MEKQIPNVRALAVDDTHIVIACPFHKRKRDRYHIHGSCGNLLNRCTHRSGHCDHWKYGYNIIIDNETDRGTFRNGRILKRSLNPMHKLHMKQLKEELSKDNVGKP